MADYMTLSAGAADEDTLNRCLFSSIMYALNLNNPTWPFFTYTSVHCIQAFSPLSTQKKKNERADSPTQCI